MSGPSAQPRTPYQPQQRRSDQSPERNDLGVEPIGGNGSPDVGAIANALPVVIDGHQVYGVSGMVLDALDCETANGTVVRQWAQLDNTCQQRDLAS
jgi:hypothetical protein